MLIERLKEMQKSELNRTDLQGINSTKQYIDDLHLSITINAIVAAAEREGGIQNINFCGTKKRFRDSIQKFKSKNYFYYNNNKDHSTKIIKCT